MTRKMEMKDKMILARNTLLRSVSGGYGRILEESELKAYVYIRQNTVMRVFSFNLYTQTVLATNIATNQTYSLDYDYLLECCDIAKNPENVVLDAISIVNVCPVKEFEDSYKKILNVVIVAVLFLSALIVGLY